VGTAILADTVGFIRHLPHDLVAAFKATLKETQEATLLLHVVDASDERFRENMDAVHLVLDEIDAGDVPRLIVMNKIDCLEGAEPRIERNEDGLPRCVWVSAMEGVGIDLLFRALTERLSGTMVKHTLRLPPENAGRYRSKFYQLGCILREEYESDGCLMVDIRLPLADWSRLQKKESNLLDDFIVA
jgi:GTPase